MQRAGCPLFLQVLTCLDDEECPDFSVIEPRIQSDIRDIGYWDAAVGIPEATKTQPSVGLLVEWLNLDSVLGKGPGKEDSAAAGKDVLAAIEFIADR